MNRIAQLEEFLRENPQDPFLHYALTMEYLKVGDKDKTLIGFKYLLENFPDYIGSYYHFGKFLESLGEIKDAEKVYKEGILVASRLRNMHAKSELMGALNLLLGMDDDDDC